MPVEVVIRSGDDERIRDLDALRANLENPAPMLKAIGALVSANAQRAFREQRLGADEWPEQYPGQRSPFLHVAGLVSDVVRGATIKSRRFTRKPPLFETGELFRSLDDEGSVDTPEAYVVEVGSTVEYAAQHQFSGESVQEITPPAKARLLEFIESDEGEPYYLRLLHLAKGPETRLVTAVNARPYLGVAGVEEEIQDVVEKGVAFGPDALDG